MLTLTFRGREVQDWCAEMRHKKDLLQVRPWAWHFPDLDVDLSYSRRGGTGSRSGSRSSDYKRSAGVQRLGKRWSRKRVSLSREFFSKAKGTGASAGNVPGRYER